MWLRDVADAIGRGLLAGVAGTAAMTVSSTLEAKLQGRGSSSAPADAAGKVLGVQARNPDGEARFATAVHWGYGTGWGAVRGLIGLTGMRGPAAMVSHFGAVWGSELAMLPALDVAPPLWKQPLSGIGVDAFHHLVYAAATSAAYTILDR